MRIQGHGKGVGVWAAVGQALINTLLPPRCQACGGGLDCLAAGQTVTALPLESRRLGPVALLKEHLCADCLKGVILIQAPMCTCCGQMFAGREGPDHICGACSGNDWQFGRARAAAIFDASLVVLVHRLKYNGRVGLARPLGKLMLAKLREHWDPADFDRLVPIPLHPRRIRDRGFNQSLLLLRSWNQVDQRMSTGLKKCSTAPELLERIKPTISQTGLGRRERVANLKNAFRVPPGTTVTGLKVLLVDDVFTTGATANECARTLMHAGARSVDVFTLARTQKEYGTWNHGKNS